jgi:hypothetical protein
MFCTIAIPAYIEKMDGYFGYSMMSTTPFLIIIEVVFPIVIACAVFRYLHTSSGTTLIHSLPLSRRTLFKGSFLSGLILTISPVITIFLAILPLYNFAPYPGNYYSNEDFFYSTTWEGPYFVDWLILLGMTLLVLFFMSALTALSASLTGNGVSLMAITLVLNFIVFFVYLIVAGYLDTFLIGFSNMSQGQEEVLLRLNPLFFSAAWPYSFEFGLLGSVLMIVIYLVIAAALVFAAYKLYKLKKLENAGRPLNFRFAEIIITYLITLVCMAGMGIAFYYQSSGYGYYVESYFDHVLAIISLIIGSLIGAAVAFMVVTMLMQKTPRIFTKKTFKSFGIFLIIGALFIAFTVFDMTGYTNRVPTPGQVKTAEVTFSSYPFSFPYVSLWSYELRNDMTARAETDEEIQALTVFHRGMIEHEKAYRSGSRGGSDYSSWRGDASFVYDLNGPFKLYRSYDLHSGYSNADLRESLAVMTCFREGMTLERIIGYEHIAGFTIRESKSTRDSDSSQQDIRLSDDEVIALARCLDNDFLRLSASEHTEKSPDVSFKLTIEARYPRSGNYHGYNTYDIDYIVTQSYTETLAWLKVHPDADVHKSGSDIAS